MAALVGVVRLWWYPSNDDAALASAWTDLEKISPSILAYRTICADTLEEIG
jgi:hypothetical protein